MLLWRISDDGLQSLARVLAPEARTAWGSHRADGLYFVITWLQEAIDTFDGEFGRIELADGGLTEA